MLKDVRLVNCHQNCLRFHGKVAYTGFPRAGDSIEEGTRLGQVLGDKEVLFMRNHGVLTVGPNVAWAFDSLYYLERVAMFQVNKKSHIYPVDISL